MPKPKSTLLRASIALNILLLGLLLVGLWFGLQFQQQIKDNQANRQARYSAEKESAFAASKLERADVVFLGDSITDAGAWDEYYPGLTVANRGVSSNETSHVAARLDEIVRLRPGKLFLMIGVNDISGGRGEAEIRKDYQAILARLEADLPDTEIYVQSTLPVDAEFWVPGVNEGVSSLNTWLKNEAEKRGHTYLDVGALFKAQDGSLDRSYSPDGLHLSGPAYAKWRKFLEPHITED